MENLQCTSFLLSNFQEVPFKCMVSAMVGEEEWISLCGENYLPDLGHEKDSDQILFEQKVFRANENSLKLMKL